MSTPPATSPPHPSPHPTSPPTGGGSSAAGGDVSDDVAALIEVGGVLATMGEGGEVSGAGGEDAVEWQQLSAWVVCAPSDRATCWSAKPADAAKRMWLADLGAPPPSCIAAGAAPTATSPAAVPTAASQGAAAHAAAPLLMCWAGPAPASRPCSLRIAPGASRACAGCCGLSLTPADVSALTKLIGCLTAEPTPPPGSPASTSSSSRSRSPRSRSPRRRSPRHSGEPPVPPPTSVSSLEVGAAAILLIPSSPDIASAIPIAVAGDPGVSAAATVASAVAASATGPRGVRGWNLALARACLSVSSGQAACQVRIALDRTSSTWI